MDKEKAREAAKEKAVAKFLSEFLITPLHSGQHFSEGFDAGYSAAQGQWVKIEGPESLPTENGKYLAALKSPSWSVPMYVVIEWKDGDWGRDSNVVAWQPVEPFTE